MAGVQQFAPELLLKVATYLVQRVACSSSPRQDEPEQAGSLVAGPGGCVSLGPGDLMLDHALRRLEQQPRLPEQLVVQTGLRAKPNSSLGVKGAVELGTNGTGGRREQPQEEGCFV